MITRKPAGGFVMLEVLISLVILGMAVAAVMQSFTVSVNAIRRNEATTQACLLAEMLLQDLMVQPPQTRFINGSFEPQGFPFYLYEVETTEEEIRYRNLKTKAGIDGLKPLIHMRIKITFDDQRRKRYEALDTEVILPPMERYSYNAKFLNGIFLQEADQ